MSYYGTVAEGDTFFETVMNPDAWENATDNEKIAALTTASRLIDTFRYSDSKADPDQELQFPRGDDTEVPEKIEQAAYYIAERLLDGFDIDEHFEELNTLKAQIGSVSETKNSKPMPKHLYFGVPSYAAWNLICQYFDREQLTLIRVT